MTAPVTFSLKPFESVAETTDLVIVVTVARKQNILSLSYLLEGDLNKVAIPNCSESGERKDRLWEQTCFEFFVAKGTSHTHADPYWEFNLSPSGDWNVFALCGYRQGLQAETAFSTMPIYTRSLKNAISLDVSVDVGQLVDASQPLRMGVSAVVLSAGEESFWAIAHPAPQADFHHPDSFVIELEPA